MSTAESGIFGIGADGIFVVGEMCSLMPEAFVAFGETVNVLTPCIFAGELAAVGATAYALTCTTALATRTSWISIAVSLTAPSRETDRVLFDTVSVKSMNSVRVSTYGTGSRGSFRRPGFGFPGIREFLQAVLVVGAGTVGILLL